MVGRVYRLMDTKRIEMVQREVNLGPDEILVKPDYLSICAADQRYYFGKRNRKILNKKLPMALIHEATGTVLYDKSGKLPIGSKVVLMPLIDKSRDSSVKANYNPENRFMSSGADGFMRDFVTTPQTMVIPVLTGDYSVIYVFSEVVSVVINALEAFEKSRVTGVKTIGVWGDGSMGYVVSLVIKCLYPNVEIFVFGKTPRKLHKFSFVNETYNIDEIPANLSIDHCFECVGGKGSEEAIEQMLNLTAPQGCVSLLGVSEAPVSVNTRTVLDKGLKLIGNSRSDAEDMKKAVSLIRDSDICGKYLEIMISEKIEVKNEKDMVYAFEQSSLNDFKTVIKWAV